MATKTTRKTSSQRNGSAHKSCQAETPAVSRNTRTGKIMTQKDYVTKANNNLVKAWAIMSDKSSKAK